MRPHDTSLPEPAGPAAGGPLAGCHALVTGGGRGIGAAIARSLSAAGARITLMGRTASSLAKVAGALPTACVTVPVDLARPEGIEDAFAAAVAQAGPVEILVNNAGAAYSAPFGRTALADLERLLALNLTAVFACCRMVLPAMLAAGRGRIVNIASTAGLRGYAYAAAYCAAKHGVIGLTRALALETARRGVTVNAVCPGFTDTDLTADAIATIQRHSGRSAAEARAELERFNPQARLVRPEEVADTVLWLCQPGSAAITGQSVVVAGGEVM